MSCTKFCTSYKWICGTKFESNWNQWHTRPWRSGEPGTSTRALMDDSTIGHAKVSTLWDISYKFLPDSGWIPWCQSISRIFLSRTAWVVFVKALNVEQIQRLWQKQEILLRCSQRNRFAAPLPFSSRTCEFGRLDLFFLAHDLETECF